VSLVPVRPASSLEKGGQEGWPNWEPITTPAAPFPTAVKAASSDDRIIANIGRVGISESLTTPILEPES
jgi:hypothetical protein